MNKPAIFSLKVRNPTKNVDDSLVSCTVGLPLITLFANKSSSYTWQHGTAKEQGHGKKSYKIFWTMQGFWRLFGKGRMFGRPFFKTNPEELSTLCIYPKQLLNNTKNVSINKILSITNFSQYFYPAT